MLSVSPAVGPQTGKPCEKAAFLVPETELASSPPSSDPVRLRGKVTGAERMCFPCRVPNKGCSAARLPSCPPSAAAGASAVRRRGGGDARRLGRCSRLSGRGDQRWVKICLAFLASVRRAAGSGTAVPAPVCGGPAVSVALAQRRAQVALREQHVWPGGNCY